jgi:hypothetical protein
MPILISAVYEGPRDCNVVACVVQRYNKIFHRFIKLVSNVFYDPNRPIRRPYRKILISCDHYLRRKRN